MSFGIWSRTVRNQNGEILADAMVEIREVQDSADPDAAPVTKATIYDDFAGNSEKANPFQVDEDGVAEFYADGDFYHIVITVDGIEKVYLNQPLGTAQARDADVGSDGNVPKWDADGNLVDSGKAAADIGSGGGGGTSVVLDLGDDESNESSGIDEIATSGDTNAIFTNPSGDKLLIDLSKNWPTADQAAALASDALDAIGEIAAALRTGVDSKIVTGTAGTAGNFAQWNSDGDAVDSGVAVSAVFTTSSDVDHDDTAGFVANEHIDHSGVSITGGTGLSGGGDLTASRSLTVDIGSLTSVTAASDDEIMIEDDSDAGALKRVRAQSIADLGGGSVSPFDPEHATDGGTDEYDSATNTTPPGDGVEIVRDFQSANTTTTPTLDGKTMTTRDDSALWAGAINGPHRLQYKSGTDTYLVLDPAFKPNPTIQTFTTSGTWNRPAGCRRIRVRERGAGGGGGSAISDATDKSAAGSGGGQGQYREFVLDVTGISSSTITIGPGGAGGTSGGNGSAGGDTTWNDGTNTITAAGGSGGEGSSSVANGEASVGGAGGAGGAGTADHSVNGAPGGNGITVAEGASSFPLAASGVGGGEGGGQAIVETGTSGSRTAGNDGTQGGGGSGAALSSQNSGAATNPAGDGGDGYMIVEEYY